MKITSILSLLIGMASASCIIASEGLSCATEAIDSNADLQLKLYTEERDHAITKQRISIEKDSLTREKSRLSFIAADNKVVLKTDIAAMQKKINYLQVKHQSRVGCWPVVIGCFVVPVAIGAFRDLKK